VDQPGLPRGRHLAPGRDLRGGRRRGSRSVRGPASAASVRARGPGRGRRRFPRSGRPSGAVDLLPRAVGLRRRHDRPDRGADRAVRPRLPRPRAGTLGTHRGAGGGAQPELRRRRHRCRRADRAPDAVPPGHPLEPVPHADPRRLPVLVGHPADPGRARPLRRTRRPDRPARHLRHPRTPRHKPGSPAARARPHRCPRKERFTERSCVRAPVGSTGPCP
jgi:hypothetical protein